MKNQTQETTPLFNEFEDYTIPTEDRKIKWRLEDGHIIYLNLPQKQFLTRHYFNDSKQKELENKCIIPSERNGMVKRCRKSCKECPYYHSGKNSYGIASLDELMESYEWEPISNEYTPLENAIHQIQKELMYKEFSKLEDKLDKLIIELTLSGLTERQIAATINVPQTTINSRKIKIIKQIKKNLNIL